MILVIDDEADLADTCARVLRRAGFECLVAYDSPAALALLESVEPALVLSDINLPTSDGYEIARCVRRKSPEVPIILMTTHHDANVPIQVARSGATGYLRKPFSNAELGAIVKLLTSYPS